MTSKAALSSAQECILRACQRVKSVEVDGKSASAVRTLKALGLVGFTATHVPGRRVYGHQKIVVWITPKGERWFWKAQNAKAQGT